MKEQQWRRQRDDRTLRYAGRVLDPTRSVVLRTDAKYATRYDGQVAILTAANLLGRMTPSLVLDLPDQELVPPLPWAGQDLREFVIDSVAAADPFARLECRPPRDNDQVIYLGRAGAETVAHGMGWNVYLGPSPSPLQNCADGNPTGAALTAILSVANLFMHGVNSLPSIVSMNTLTWENNHVADDSVRLPTEPQLGNVWTVGTGSVGTAALYFIVMATRGFDATLIDMDQVAIHNLDRSPIFCARDELLAKVSVTERFLRNTGVRNIVALHSALDETPIWGERRPGTPDLVISTANERQVRDRIEQGYPPIQLYGTTGRNWQASLIRHIPLRDPCSRCLFDDEPHVTTECATGNMRRSEVEHVVDAAIPFLSFAAGAMVATEVLKLVLPGYPFTTNRIGLYNYGCPVLRKEPLARRNGCHCHIRSRTVHRQAITGSAYAGLSLPLRDMPTTRSVAQP